MGVNKGIMLMLVCTAFTAFGQLFLKRGADDLFPIYLNFELMIGFILYGVGALLMIYALKLGDLNILYPIISLTFIWVTMLSIVFLEETVSTSQYLGIGTILFGVALVSMGGKR
jgi:uncharacterized membrane protein